MRYEINFCALVNKLLSHYLHGRNLILLASSFAEPLQELNRAFVEYAKETRIEAAMTSQKIMFEWYLTRKMSNYFLAPGKIAIMNGEPVGVPIYHQDADIPDRDNLLLYSESEKGMKTAALYGKNEKTVNSSHSFVVYSPAINTELITQEQYVAMLSYYVDKYRLAGKTYTIKLNG